MERDSWGLGRGDCEERGLEDVEGEERHSALSRCRQEKGEVGTKVKNSTIDASDGVPGTSGRQSIACSPIKGMQQRYSHELLNSIRYTLEQISRLRTYKIPVQSTQSH